MNQMSVFEELEESYPNHGQEDGSRSEGNLGRRNTTGVLGKAQGLYEHI